MIDISWWSFATGKYHFYEAVDFISLPGQFRLSEKEFEIQEFYQLNLELVTKKKKIVFYEFYDSMLLTIPVILLHDKL